MRDEATLLLRASEVAALLPFPECIAVVETAFRVYGEGKASPPGVMGIHVSAGGFHIKAGVLELTRNCFAAKINGNFPGNRERFGLPTIQGLIVLCDGDNGRVLAVMDSMEVTARRTAAATAIAAKYLARHDSESATVCGCGVQGRNQLRALAQVIGLRKAYAHDVNVERSQQFARDMSEELGIELIVVTDLCDAVRQSDICITCTTSRSPLLHGGDVLPGTFVAAVGADNPEKQELAPDLLISSKVVTDVLEQCASIGDLHQAIAAGAMTKSDVHAELGEIVAGKKSGRMSGDEIIIFDSTGMALQDVAAAAVVYENALGAGCGIRLDFAG